LKGCRQKQGTSRTSITHAKSLITKFSQMN